MILDAFCGLLDNKVSEEVDIKIKEELLHYLWQLKKFDHTDLRTTDGKEIRILSYGHLNTNAGPDFLEGKIEIDGTIWAGHIEMHLSASDWIKHGHTDDPSYHNVILHVVYNYDGDITLPDHTVIPTLSLQERISEELIQQYQHLLSNQDWIPCEQHLSTINDLKKSATIERMMAERMILKSESLRKQLEELNNDLSELVYRRVAYSFGLSINATAMETLATTLPYAIISKHRDNLFQLEALLLGQSGLIDNVEDEYADSLQREYGLLAQKYGLTPMNIVQWKYAKLRPAAFPTIRIAQFAKLLYQVPRLDNLILTYSLDQIREQLTLKVDGYWKYHYRFGTASAPRAKALGKNKQEVIIINAVVPLLWLCGENHQDQKLKDKAVALLEDISAEKNSITNKWQSLGMTNTNAAASQGLIHLKKSYCNHKRCLKCPIGVSILSSKN